MIHLIPESERMASQAPRAPAACKDDFTRDLSRSIAGSRQFGELVLNEVQQAETDLLPAGPGPFRA